VPVTAGRRVRKLKSNFRRRRYVGPRWARLLHRFATKIVALLFVVLPIWASAQTVTVVPSGYITSALGGNVQFTATVTGSTNANVTWSIPGQKRNSTALGTITSTGLYTAPATMPSNGQVEVLATSQANPNSTCMEFVYLLAAGPTITSVSPNPLPVGSSTVTITGSGFQQNAVVVDTSNGSGVQYGPSSVTSNTITLSIYQPSAPNATFTVTNPGSAPSAGYVVPVSGGVKTYALSVANGSGSGNYAAGSTVSITANAPPAGQSFVNWTGATVANPTATTTTLIMPASSTSVTANYTSANSTFNLTVNNGKGGGTFTAGTIVTITANTPPLGDVFLNWTGASVGNATSATTTITMPPAPTTVTANYQVAAQVPFPVSSHPRLWITPADLPRLQSWATPSNPVYANLKGLLGTCVSLYQTDFFPGGVANPNYPDPGDTQGYQGWLTEEVGFVLAFNSLIDPSPSNRATYAQYARNLLMYAMNLAAQGPLANAPFRDPQFPTYNRANWTGAQWPLIVDWIYNATDGQGNAILSASDKATIRKVFMLWASECTVADTTGGDSPQLPGVTNSLSLLNGGAGAYRMASNNYYLGHARILTMMGLCFDPSDDPAVDATQSPAVIGNSLRSYILDGIGAWLYQEYAMMGDPQTVAADYGLPGNGTNFGLASGGLPPEGMLYGESFGFMLGQLLALQTSGFNNAAISGPQIKLLQAPVWDRYVKGFLSSLTPAANTPPSESWLGPVYQMDSYGDLLRLYITPDYMRPIALLALLEQEQGQSTHVNAARWFDTNVVSGPLNSNIADPWTWGTADSILYYMLLDPTALPATDPRPSYPLNFFDPAAGRILSRTDWTPSATGFDYRASWESINHQDGDGGQFEFFRNGEWLTKEMSNYDNNAVGLTTYYHNTLGLKNWNQNGTPNLNWFENGEWANGSNWMLGANAGDPTTVASFGTGYTYASSDLTNLYNRPDVWKPSNNVTDITQATRSILWLNGDNIVIYDRATSIHTGLFKTFNMCLQDAPTINGNVATEVMPDGQQLFVQTLLPLNATLSSVYAAGNLSPHSELDPMQYVLTDLDPTLPSDTRFLHVLQGADATASMVPAAYIQSASGTPFDGAVFGSSAVFFPVSATSTLAATTFNLPATATTFVVAGLTPSTSYGVTAAVTANGKTVTLTPGGAGSTTDTAGLLKVSI